MSGLSTAATSFLVSRVLPVRRRNKFISTAYHTQEFRPVKQGLMSLRVIGKRARDADSRHLDLSRQPFSRSD
jgi:hypothetical protein